MFDYQKRFVNINEYFRSNPEDGILATIPTMLAPEEDSISIEIYEIIKFKPNGAEIITCDNFYPNNLSLPESLQYTHEYINSDLSCASHGEFITAIPIFDINESNKTLLGIKNEAIVPYGATDEELVQFDSRIGDNPVYVMNAANKFAISKGYAGGISTCTRNSSGSWTVFFIKDGYLEQDSIHSYKVNYYTNFSYNFLEDQKRRLIEAHELVISKISNCNDLDPTYLGILQENYKLVKVNHIPIDSNSDCSGALGCAIVNTHIIWIDLALHDTIDSSVEFLAATLIHEMMHVAGFNHPTITDPNNIPQEYYDSLPVLAEKCIIGSAAGTTLRCSDPIRR